MQCHSSASVRRCLKNTKLKTKLDTFSEDTLIRQLRSKMSAADVEDFIQQNRDVAKRVETFRGYWESEKHWEARREFILRNMENFDNDQLDHLLSLSMVWSNNVFLGCRYLTHVFMAFLHSVIRFLCSGLVKCLISIKLCRILV